MLIFLEYEIKFYEYHLLIAIVYYAKYGKHEISLLPF